MRRNRIVVLDPSMNQFFDRILGVEKVLVHVFPLEGLAKRFAHSVGLGRIGRCVAVLDVPFLQLFQERN